MRTVSDFIGKYMAVIVLAVSVVALFKPETCLWIRTGWINYLLMIVMFGMGLTMKVRDFAVVFTRPRDVVIGCLAQYFRSGPCRGFSENEQKIISRAELIATGKNGFGEHDEPDTDV